MLEILEVKQDDEWRFAGVWWGWGVAHSVGNKVPEVTGHHILTALSEKSSLEGLEWRSDRICLTLLKDHSGCCVEMGLGWEGVGCMSNAGKMW